MGIAWIMLVVYVGVGFVVGTITAVRLYSLMDDDQPQWLRRAICVATGLLAMIIWPLFARELIAGICSEIRGRFAGRFSVS